MARYDRATYNVEDTTMVDFILGELNKIMSNIVIKLDYIAARYETLEIKKSAEKYIEAIDKTDRVEYITELTYDILDKAGLREGTMLNDGTIVDRKLLYFYKTQPKHIPNEFKTVVLNEYRNDIISKYIEYNDYYRELNGEPPYDATIKDFVFTDIVDEEIDISKPIHLMSEYEIILLNKKGEIDRLIQKYPNKKYLRYIRNRVPYYQSRKARNYQILYLDRPVHQQNLYNIFTSIYYDTSKYVQSTLKDPAYTLNDKYFEGFLGMFILVITSQRFISHYFKSGIKKDFFSKDIIKMLMDSYGFPFYSEISITYLTKIAKNLNMLLKYKSTDKVFYDIFELFGLKDVTVNSYYLLKTRKTDSKGDPIFLYTEEIDEEGNTIEVEDVRNMYDVNFVEVPTTTDNLSLDLLDRSKYLDYDLVTSNDQFWGDGGDNDELLKSVLDAEFNYIQTKYISMSSRYELTELTFEIAYLFRMIVDLKMNEKLLELPVGSLGRFNIFDVITALQALVAIKLNYAGNIMNTKTKILSVLGFNFNTDREYLDKIIKDAKLENPDDLILRDAPKLFKNEAELINLYLDNKKVYKNLMKRKYECYEHEEFNAYKKIYDATMISDYNCNMYKLKDGTIAETYLDYLKGMCLPLYKYVCDTNEENLIEQMDLLLVSLDNYLHSDEFNNVFLNIPSLTLDIIKKFVYYLMDIFKSYTVDLLGMNVVYHVSDKQISNIKYTFYEKPIVNVEYENDFNWRDYVEHVFVSVKPKDIIECIEYVKFKCDLLYKDFMILDDEESGLISEYNTGDSINGAVVDLMEVQSKEVKHYDNIKLKDVILFDRRG